MTTEEQAEAIVDKWYRITIDIFYAREDNQGYFASGTMTYKCAINCAIK